MGRGHKKREGAGGSKPAPSSDVPPRRGRAQRAPLRALHALWHAQPQAQRAAQHEQQAQLPQPVAAQAPRAHLPQAQWQFLALPLCPAVALVSSAAEARPAPRTRLGAAMALAQSAGARTLAEAEAAVVCW